MAPRPTQLVENNPSKDLRDTLASRDHLVIPAAVILRVSLAGRGRDRLLQRLADRFSPASFMSIEPLKLFGIDLDSRFHQLFHDIDFVDNCLSLFVKAAFNKLLPAGDAHHWVYRGLDQGVHELVSNADQLVVPRTPPSYINGSFPSVVVSSARSVNEANFHSFVANALNIRHKRGGFHSEFYQSLAELAAQIS